MDTKKREHKEKSSRFYSILHVEIMFYHAARRHLKLAKEGWPPVEKALKDLKKVDDQWERLQADEGLPPYRPGSLVSTFRCQRALT
ncbi:MAG: hypothetical protein ACJ8FY_14985 [Gemmataceae bacterium]